MARDGGELGRGLCRNAAALQDSIDHLLVRHQMLQQAGQPLAHPLDGMPQAVIADLTDIHRALADVLAQVPNSN